MAADIKCWRCGGVVGYLTLVRCGNAGRPLTLLCERCLKRAKHHRRTCRLNYVRSQIIKGRRILP